MHPTARRARRPRRGWAGLAGWLLLAIAAQPRDGGLLVLVTHQVTISAVSGTFTDSGTGVLMALGEGGLLERIGTLAFGIVAE